MFLPHVLSLSLVLAGQTAPAKETPRKPSAIAPSLPALTLEQENKLDAIIDRFILYDTGKLPGVEGKKALSEFEALGREAVPALIRGLNKAVQIEHSCPTLVISRKLSRFLASSNDPELLEFARDNIGGGVGKTRHAGVIQDLRVQCMLRKNALVRAGVGVVKLPVQMTKAELMQAVDKERGPRLRMMLTELGTRRGPEPAAVLTAHLTNPDKDIQTLTRGLLESNLVRQGAALVRQKLSDDNAEVRKVAVRAAARTAGMTADLIDRLDDRQSDVSEEAHAALVKLSKGQNFGPQPGADSMERQEAIARWKAWLAKQKR